MTPLQSLVACGTKLWLDSVDPDEIARNRALGATGATSNPIIISDLIQTGRFDADLQAFVKQGLDDEAIAWAMTDKLVKSAQDVFRPVSQETKGNDGFVSFECSPLLAHKTQETIEEAQRLFDWVDRKNVMIKIPGTHEGIPAIEESIYRGININITLLFSLASYRDTINAYIRGLERRAAEGKPVTGIASVASFFVSRIDTAVDKRIEEKISGSNSEEEKSRLRSVEGKIAIANADNASGIFVSGPRTADVVNTGTITVDETYSPTDTDNDGDIDGPFALVWGPDL